MTRLNRIKLLFLLCFAGVVLAHLTTGVFVRPAEAFSGGPPAGHTNAPEELNCTECHLPDDGEGTGGQFKLETPASYVPGQTYQITVRHTVNSDPTRQRWGFQLVALDDIEERAGTFQSLDNLTRVIEGQVPYDGRQYIEHTRTGTFAGQTGGAVWTFSWTAPSTNIGRVIFYAAGNQANNDLNSSGDHIVYAITAALPATSTVNPIDDAGFFVRQHYLDFLNREPDSGGLNYWTGQITQCGASDNCVRQRRVEVSAEFFIALEFQNTGYFGYLTRLTALGAQPTFAQYQSDRASLGTGAEADRTAFLNAFVQRAEFTARYPLTMSQQVFVQALIDSTRMATGVNLTARYNELLTEYQTNNNRARVVRLIVDDANVRATEYNRAFVLSQYFGYLRRNPDPSGYQFWVNVLTSQPSNFRFMVCNFITSAEYQQRFSPAVTHFNNECSGF